MKQSNTIKVVFASNNKPFSLIIKLFTLSGWSHIGIMDGNSVIDSTLATGVRKTPFQEWRKHYDYFVIVDMPVKEGWDAIEFARQQVGKKYDPFGIISLVFRRNIENRDKWFCSELVAACLGITERTWRISPQFLWNLYKIAKGYITNEDAK